MIYVKFENNAFTEIKGQEADLLNNVPFNTLISQNIYPVNDFPRTPWGKDMVSYSYQFDVNNNVEVVPVYQNLPMELLHPEFFNALADKRWQLEQAGMTFNGMSIPTDDRSQSKIMAMVLACQLNPAYTVNYKLASGDFITLDAQSIMALAQAVRGHVQTCFDREEKTRTKILACITPEELQAIDLDLELKKDD